VRWVVKFKYRVLEYGCCLDHSTFCLAPLPLIIYDCMLLASQKRYILQVVNLTEKNRITRVIETRVGCIIITKLSTKITKIVKSIV